MTKIIKIDPADYGIEESKAKQIEAVFIPMFNKMKELEVEYKEILKLDITPETCKKAKELRGRYVKTRTGTAEIHKKAKAFYLAGGKFVDGWKNAQLFAAQGIEDELNNIEKHFENIEKERKEELRKIRVNRLIPYNVENVELLKLGEMTEEVWTNFYSGTKTSFDAKIKAEADAEKQRLKEEKEAREKRDEDIKQKAIEDTQKKADRDRDELIKKQARDKQALIDKQDRDSKALINQQKQRDKDAKDKIEQDKQDIKDAEDKKKREEELMAKRAKYIKFLKDGGYKDGTEDFHIEKTPEKHILYKKVSEFINK